MTALEVMEDLGRRIGTDVIVRYVQRGTVREQRGKLCAVDPFQGVSIDFGAGAVPLPFIGWGTAIQVIFDAQTVAPVFENLNIEDKYDLQGDELGMYDHLKYAFDEDVADSWRANREEWERSWSDDNARLDLQAQQLGDAWLQRGLAHVLPATASDWHELARFHAHSHFTSLALEAAVLLMEALTAGMSCKDAHDQVMLRGFNPERVAAAASIASAFHARGEEFRRWWNRLYLPEEVASVADEQGGVANPHVITFDPHQSPTKTDGLPQVPAYFPIPVPDDKMVN